MATLYVENVPEVLYEALRGRAWEHRRSIAAEVLSLLEENVPTEKQLKARRAVLRKLQRMHAQPFVSDREFPSTEEMQREDLARFYS